MKTFTPFDNSYQQCIDDNGRNHYLAGTITHPKRTILKILIQPFEMKTTNCLGDEVICTFIIGLDETTGLRHLCLKGF